MTSNEIDDIFSTIHKTKTREENSSKSSSGPVAKTTTSKASKKAEKRRKKKSEKQAVSAAECEAPQVIMESSEGNEKLKEACAAVGVSLPAVVVTVVDAGEGTRVSSNHISKRMLDEDDDGFFDSRGDGGKRKKTDDGYDIYHEDELRIGLGGDTADCPFDCTCCF